MRPQDDPEIPQYLEVVPVMRDSHTALVFLQRESRVRQKIPSSLKDDTCFKMISTQVSIVSSLHIFVFNLKDGFQGGERGLHTIQQLLPNGRLNTALDCN